MSSIPEPKQFDVSVVILTLNEESNLPLCLSGIRDLAREVFVVDAGSTDGTRAIAERTGATVVEHPFETHSAQWQWALEHLPLSSDWVLALDADQQLTAGLADEIRNLQISALEGINGIYIKRQQWFRGRWIKHGGYYPKYLLKLFRRGKVVIDGGDLVDHHFYVAGRVLKLRHDLIESNVKEDDISFWIQKHNRYATLLAQEEISAARSASTSALKPQISGNPDQRALALKRAWRRLPLYVRPFAYFLYRYFLRLGFLDGKQGAIFHFLQAFWFRLLVDIHIDDLRQVGGATVEARQETLASDITTGKL